jgi:predicted nucleic acid-binding protein
MILIDTSTVVAWLDQSHPDHKTSAQAIVNALMDDDVAVSVVTLAELAVGGRTWEAVEADLKGMIVIEVTADDAWRAGQVFARLPRKQSTPLPDFFIRAQAAERSWRHLTNDRRRLGWWPDVEFMFGN